MWPIVFILVLLIPILAIVLDSRLGQALAARLERRGALAPDDVTAERIAFLEGEVERLSGELRRVDEESQFLHKLLVERTQESAALTKGDADE